MPETMTTKADIEPGPQEAPPKKRGLSSKVIIISFVVVGLVIAGSMFDIKQALQDSLAWIDGLGPSGPVIFILLYIAATVLFLPGSILTLGAGALFGVVLGSVYVSIASIIGATLAFIIGRTIARDRISGKISGNEKFSAVDNAVGREGWKIVLLTRLSPIFPFNLLNYSFGLTKVSLSHYFFASWIGMFPGTVMYVYLGSLAGELGRMGADGREKTTGEWTLYVVGLIATIAVTVYVTKIAKKALKEKVS